MKKNIVFMVSIILIIVSISFPVFAADIPEGTAWIESHGYSGCVKLFNDEVSVVLEPNCGGRVLEYNLNGKNVLYIDPDQDGWTYTPGGPRVGICAGRFDIGPEKLVPGRTNLWLGKWTAEITGPRSARMTSIKDESTGVQLIREFELDKDSSHLKCTQIIKNISDSTKQYNHWSRTFAVGGGICVIPLSGGGRFPEGYIVYEPARGPKYMNFRPDKHENVAVRDDFLLIGGPTDIKKYGIDSYTGWFGYITRNDMVFVKKYPVYPERVYGELAAYTISIYYNEDIKSELEPIGPRETLAPGESAAFTEEWCLLPYTYPGSHENVDLKAFNDYVEQHIY